jgi:signal transduction histidine kinase
MPSAFQKNLFKTFYRANNVGTIAGTGLGLAIVKRAVDAICLDSLMMISQYQQN